MIFESFSGYLVPLDFFISTLRWELLFWSYLLASLSCRFENFTACVGISSWSLRLLGERPIVFHFPRCQFRDVAQGSDRMIRLCSSSGALISSQAFIFGPSFVSETGFITIVIVCDPLHLSTFMNSLSNSLFSFVLLWNVPFRSSLHFHGVVLSKCFFLSYSFHVLSSSVRAYNLLFRSCRWHFLRSSYLSIAICRSQSTTSGSERVINIGATHGV